MGSRVGIRLLLILVLLLAAVQTAFRPFAVTGDGRSSLRRNSAMNLGLDLQGGSLLVLEGQDTPTVRATPDAVDAAMRVIGRRVDQLGVVEPTIQRQGPNRIIVELPGVGDPQRAIALIGRTALLEFVDTGLTSLPEGARWSDDGRTVTLPEGALSRPRPARRRGAARSPSRRRSSSPAASSRPPRPASTRQRLSRS